VRQPPGWTVSTLGDLLNRLQYGYTASASPDLPGPRFLRITDLQDDGVDWSSVPGCQINDADLEKYKLQDGDLVFARSGSIEKAWRVKNAPEAVFASYLIRGTPMEPLLGPWLEAFVKSPSYLVQIGAAGAGTGMQNVNATSLAQVTLPMAPLSEQQSITLGGRPPRQAEGPRESDVRRADGTRFRRLTRVAHGMDMGQAP
jgi:type I restriction enzyme, S subunit